jgi:Ca-activated chloride channel family protein
VQLAPGQAAGNTLGSVEIILDASGSMNGLIAQRTKIDIAHDALSTLVNQLPDTANVALRAYGHRRSADCGDIELVAPLGPLDRAGLINKIKAINPVRLGQTPIGASLQMVPADLQAAKGSLHVVLVTDGEETCRLDPVRVAGELHAGNPLLKIDVVGFNIDAAAQGRLSAIAEAGGGRYFDAGDAQQLVDALKQSVLSTYHVLDAQGKEVYSGTFGDNTTLPAGRYTIQIDGATPLQIADVEVGGAQPAVIELREQDGKLVRAAP